MKQVLLIRNDSLLTGGIDSLLGKAYGVNLISKTIKDVPHLISEINDLCPGTLIFINSLEFANSILLMELLGKFPDLRILAIDERNNIIHVYEKKEVQVTQSDDLLNLVNDFVIS